MATATSEATSMKPVAAAPAAETSAAAAAAAASADASAKDNNDVKRSVLERSVADLSTWQLTCFKPDRLTVKYDEAQELPSSNLEKYSQVAQPDMIEQIMMSHSLHCWRMADHCIGDPPRGDSSDSGSDSDNDSEESKDPKRLARLGAKDSEGYHKSLKQLVQNSTAPDAIAAVFQNDMTVVWQRVAAEIAAAAATVNHADRDQLTAMSDKENDDSEKKAKDVKEASVDDSDSNAHATLKPEPVKADKPGTVICEPALLFGRQRVAARGIIDLLNETITFCRTARQGVEQVLLKDAKLKKDRVARNEEIARQRKQDKVAGAKADKAATTAATVAATATTAATAIA